MDSSASQHTSEESALVARLQAGDASAYETVVRYYGPRMLVVARRLLGQEHDSQDAVQEAFISAFRSIGSFQHDARLGTWLYRIVVNACLMKLRRRRRKPEVAIESLLPRFEGDQRVSEIQELQVFDREIEAKEVREQVRHAIESLPDAFRDILLLRDIEEMSTEETALQLNISESAVKTRLHRARMALRELLSPLMLGDSP